MTLAKTSSLIGLTEIAQLLNVSRQRVHVLRKRRDFPSPIAELAVGPVWNSRDLSAFVDGWNRAPGRQKKST
jgi:predicted DNA-binding transcriptional regulator AlpA